MTQRSVHGVRLACVLSFWAAIGTGTAAGQAPPDQPPAAGTQGQPSDQAPSQPAAAEGAAPAQAPATPAPGTDAAPAGADADGADAEAATGSGSAGLPVEAPTDTPADGRPAPTGPPTPADPAGDASPPTGAPASGPIIELDVEDAESFDDPDAAEGEEGDDPDDPAKEQGIDSWRYSLVTAQRAFNLSRPRGVTLGGYGQHEFLARDGEDPQFRAHRYVLFIYGQISDRIQTSTELEFEFAGSPLKRDGTLGPGEVLLEFSVIDFTLFDWLVLRAGVILMPTASFNLLHDAPTRDLVDRPIAYTTIVPSTWFESGAGILGEFEIGDVTTGYELYVVNGLDARISDGFGLRAARGSHFEDNNTDKAITGRVYLSPTMGLHMGLAGYTGEYDKRGNRINMLNADFRFRALPFEFLGEAVLVQIDPGFVEGFSESSAANTRDAVPEGMRGFYLQANYHFTIGPLWDLLPADLKGATFTTALRYEAMNTDTRRTSAAGDGTRLTWGINFRPIEQLVFKCDFQWNARGSETASAAHLWQRNFWRNRTGGFLFDSLAASAAYLF